MLANFLAALSVLVPALPHPDEVRTTDGRVLVGKVARKGEALEIRTRSGTVVIDQAEVEAIRTEKELRAELKRLAGQTDPSAFAHFELAKTALGYGLTADMWEQLDLCLEMLEPGDALDARVRNFLAQLEPEVVPERYRDAATTKRVRGLARQVRRKTKPAMRAAVLEILVREQGADEALREAATLEALPAQRLVAVEALARRSDENADFVHRRTVWDRDSDVRTEAATLIREHGDPRTAVLSLARGLLHDTPAIRIRTAEAFANLGTPEAAALLTLAAPRAGIPAAAGSGGIGVRGHMAVTESRSVIRDFDVEIAQAAAVANPQISSLRSGVVLDVNVPAVVSQRVKIENAYRLALRRLAGADPGRDPATWRRWLDTHAPEAAALLAP